MKKILFTALAGIVFAMPLMAQEEEVWHYTQGWIPSWYSTSINLDDIKAASTPKNMLEAVDRMPAFPTAEQIYTVEAKEKALRDIYQPYEKALFAAWDKNGEVSRDVDRRIKVAGEKQQKSNQKAKAQYQSNVNAGLMPSQQEMMDMMMSGEINPNWSEDKIMDAMAGKFAAKWGVSKQEYLKIINMAQSNPKGAEAYIKSNHPDLYKRLYAANAPYGNENVHADDPRKPEFDRINDGLLKAQDDLQEARVAYGDNLQYSQTHSKYMKIYEQMEKEWDNSPEAKQIETIEAALQKRIEEWSLTLKNVKGDVPYPAWFTTERKKENALIDQWNRRWATKWIKVAEDGDKAYRPIFRRIAELGMENDKIGQQGDTEEMIYLTNKKLVCTLYGQMMSLYVPIRDAMAFPAIEHVATTGYTIVEAF
jgi:hypothetical protein